MAKFPDQELQKAAQARLLANKFVCRNCRAVKRATNLQIIKGEITCRKCGSHKFKPKRKK